jgi:hypothetical protein
VSAFAGLRVALCVDLGADVRHSNTLRVGETRLRRPLGFMSLSCDVILLMYVFPLFLIHCDLTWTKDGNGRMSLLISSIPLMRHGFPPLCITPSLRSVYYDALNIVSVFYRFELIPFLLSRTVNLFDSGVSHFFVLLCSVS